MKIKQIVYIIGAITGGLIIKFHLPINNAFQNLFGGTMIAFSSFNIIFDYFKRNK